MCELIFRDFFSVTGYWDSLLPCIMALCALTSYLWCVWKVFLFLGTQISGKENHPEKVLGARASKLFCSVISLILSSISFDMGIKLIQPSLTNWRLNITKYYCKTAIFWCSKVVLDGKSVRCTSVFFIVIIIKKKKTTKKVSGDLWSLSTRIDSCPWTKLFTHEHYCKAFLFNQVHIFPLAMVTFTHKVPTVPFIGMMLQAPSHWHHLVRLPFCSRSASRWDDW